MSALSLVTRLGQHRRHAGIAPLVLLDVEGGGDLDFLASDVRLGEGHLDLAVEGRAQQHAGALEDRAGVEGFRRRDRRDLDDAALLVARGRRGPRRGSRWPPLLPRKATVPMPGAAMPEPEIEPVVDVGVGERHLGGMDRTGDRLLDKGVPAGALRLGAGHQARHVLIGGDGREADPDAKADDEGRQERTLVSAGGGNAAASLVVDARTPSPGRNTTHWRWRLVH